ncbi:hypothetical protein LP414_07770 [Polaromonas sp. P1(28)-13]|nr:hypothetical protein LP414_07770 [Polaromonas sp. P1(28)-13]
MTPLADVMEHIKGNRLRALATTAEGRMKQLPNAPTLAELGYKDQDFYAMFALVGPARMAPELASKIANDTALVLRDPELKSSFLDPGAYEVFCPGAGSVHEVPGS